MYWLRDTIIDYPGRAAAAAVLVLALAAVGFFLLNGGGGRAEPAFSLNTCDSGFCLDEVKLPQKCSALSKQLCAFSFRGTKPANAGVSQVRLSSPLIVRDIKISADAQTWSATGHFMCAAPGPGLPLSIELTTPAKKTINVGRPAAPGVECSALPAPLARAAS